MSAAEIETAREFLKHVVDVDVTEFLKVRTDLRAAYHACCSLLSLRDLIFESYKARAWWSNGNEMRTFSTMGELQRALESLDERFAIVTDIANASKHMVLDQQRRRTKLWGNANTEVLGLHGGGFGSEPFGSVPFGGSASRIVVKIDQQYHDVIECVSSVHTVWKELFAENSW